MMRAFCILSHSRFVSTTYGISISFLPYSDFWDINLLYHLNAAVISSLCIIMACVEWRQLVHRLETAHLDHVIN